MDKERSSGTMKEILDSRGEQLARFFNLLIPDPLDAEDLFHTLFVLLYKQPDPDLSGDSVLSATLSLVRGFHRQQKQGRFRPVEFGGNLGTHRTPGTVIRRAWEKIPVPDRAAILLAFEAGLRKPAIASLLNWDEKSVAGRMERSLLALQAAIAGADRSSVVRRGGKKGEILAYLMGEGSRQWRKEREEAMQITPSHRSAHDQLDSAIRNFHLLYRSALRSADWKRMRKRLLREFPSSSTTVLYDFFGGPLGTVFISIVDGTIVRVGLGEISEREWVRQSVQPGALKARRDPSSVRMARRQIEEYFSGKRKSFTLPYRLLGVTTFQASVLDTCSRVPFGSVRSYKQIAEDIGRPGGMRAVGGALARNPIPILIPCHRIISHTGRLGGFSGGVALKEKLLSLEGMAGLFS